MVHPFVFSHSPPLSEERVRSGAARLQKMLNAKQQGRLDGFFKVLPKKEGDKPAAAPASKKAAPKRKVCSVRRIVCQLDC